MYQAFYGLAELPFELSPDPSYLYLTPRHREALANLEYGISARKSLTLLTGEAGTGKTTLVRAALRSEACRSARVLYLNNPTLTRTEFLDFLAHGFGLTQQASSSKSEMLRQLERELVEGRRRGITTALVIDEAQSLSYELLEEIRLLANIESNTEKLLPLVLAGQPELAVRLNEPSLRQLKQRVALRCALGLLSLNETAAYMAGRIRRAGADGSTLFTREAVRLIYERSRGVPRTISVICDNALVSGFALQQKPVSAQIVHEVCRDFDFDGAASGDDPPELVGSAAGHGRPGDPVEPGAREHSDGAAGRLFASLTRRKLFFFL